MYRFGRANASRCGRERHSCPISSEGSGVECSPGCSLSTFVAHESWCGWREPAAKEGLSILLYSPSPLMVGIRIWHQRTFFKLFKHFHKDCLNLFAEGRSCEMKRTEKVKEVFLVKSFTVSFTLRKHLNARQSRNHPPVIQMRFLSRSSTKLAISTLRRDPQWNLTTSTQSDFSLQSSRESHNGQMLESGKWKQARGVSWQLDSERDVETRQK